MRYGLNTAELLGVIPFVIVTALRKLAVPLVSVHLVHQTPLFQVVGTARAPGRLTRSGKRRQENRRKDTDDGDHHQQLDQRKTLVLSLHDCSSPFSDVDLSTSNPCFFSVALPVLVLLVACHTSPPRDILILLVALSWENPAFSRWANPLPLRCYATIYEPLLSRGHFRKVTTSVSDAPSVGRSCFTKRFSCAVGGAPLTPTPRVLGGRGSCRAAL